MRNKISDIDFTNFQFYIYKNVSESLNLDDITDEEFNKYYADYLALNYKKKHSEEDIVVSLSKNPLNESEDKEVKKTLDDYLMENNIYVDLNLNNLSPEAIKKILIVSEKKFRDADETYDKSNEIYEQSIKNMDDSLKTLQEAENFYKEKSKVKKSDYKYSAGKLIHRMYDDGKSLLGYGVLLLIIVSNLGGPLDEYKEEDKIK